MSAWQEAKPEQNKVALEATMGQLQAGPGQPGFPSVGALIESLCQLTLLLLMGSDKVAAHAAWLQMNALRRELAGFPLFRQTLLHVTFGTRAFFLAIAAPKQGSQTLLSYICLFITLNGLGETRIGWRIPCVGTSILHQRHG